MMQSVPHRLFSLDRLLAGLLGLSLLAETAVPVLMAAEPVTNSTALALWDVTTRVSAGGGYRGNVLLSSVNPEGSSFIEVTGEFSAIRLSETGSVLTLFVLAELQRYLESEQVENQGIIYAVVQVDQPAGVNNTIGGEFQYLYQNQILDVSETEVVQRRAWVVGHGLSLKPYWEHDLSEVWALKLEGSATRQIFEQDLDDYWEGYARLDLTRAYGNRSSVSLAYELRHRFYDTREQYDPSGSPISGTDLIYRYHELGAEWRHNWDTNRQWRTTFRAGVLRSEDNGSGYFNYDRAQLSALARWQRGKWYAKLQGRAGWYWYPNQFVSDEKRVRAFYGLEFRAERHIDEHWLVYAAASREWNLSNQPLEEYNDWIASGGIAVEL
jgi:hypothetical protein